MEGKDFCFYEFSEFRLDARRRALSKNDEKVPLSARNFDLLLFMVENGGRILEHDELLDKVWAGTFVEQATLKKGISALRRILDEKPENEFIKTIPRRGYSFVSPVRVVREPDETLFVRETTHEIIIEEFEETDENQPQAVKLINPPSIKKTNFTRVAVFTGAAIIVLVLAFFGYKYYFSKSVQPQFSAETVRVTRITNNGKVISGTAVSPDGTYILYPTVENDGVVLWARQISATVAKKLTLPTKGSFWAFAFAPDNSYVYYIFNNVSEPQKSGLYKLSLLGDEPQRLAENVSTLSISPDGKQIALVRLGEITTILTIDANGGNERTITTLPDNFRLWSMGWTPDSADLLCTFRKTVEDKALYYVAEMSLEDGKETVVLDAQERVVYGAHWLPDKSAMLLIVREAHADIRQIWQYFPLSQEWRRVTNDNNSYKLVSLTRDGKTIVSTQESRLATIWLSQGTLPPIKSSALINRDNFRQITDGVSSFDRLGWLADGRLMYAATEDGKETIFTINADGTNVRQITNGDDGFRIYPNVTGNGQSISFLSSRAGAKQVWRVDADGKNLTKTTTTGSWVLAAQILRDNLTVIYAAQQGGSAILYKQTPDGQTTQLNDSDTGFFVVSPDEKLLAVEAFDKTARKYRVQLHSLEDGKIIKTFDFVPLHRMSFTPDGKNLAYKIVKNDISQIMIQPLDGGEAFALTDFQTDDIFSFNWSLDGKYLAVIRGKQLNDAVLIKSENH